MDAIDVLRAAIVRAGPSAVVLPPGAASLLLDELKAPRAHFDARCRASVTNDEFHVLCQTRRRAVAASRAGA